MALSAAERLRVAIDLRVLPGKAGGTAPFVCSFISSLSHLVDGSETYVLVVPSQAQLEWLKPLSGPNQKFVLKLPKSKQSDILRNNGNGALSFPALLKRSLGPLLPAARCLQRVLSVPVPASQWPEVPVSDGFYEALGCDVIHFPTQGYVLCALPTIYNPHDLQHLHYPQFFRPEDIAERETIYPAGCRFAHTIAVGSQWAKEDVARQYRIHPDKIQVIPEGAPTQLYSEPSEDFLRRTKSKYELVQPFALYPAVTWPHKNHMLLLNACARLRDVRNLNVKLICTGARHDEHWPRVEQRINELNLHSQVKFLGFIPDEDLRAIYRLSQFLVEPSLFESSSLPIFEAWSEGVPVTCSDRTALPEQVFDAALLFQPENVESIAAALEKMMTDGEFREELRQRGSRRLKDFDWTRTAKAYRALYRRAAGRPLTEEDRWLLAWDWMREPRKEMETLL